MQNFTAGICKYATTLSGDPSPQCVI